MHCEDFTVYAEGSVRDWQSRVQVVAVVKVSTSDYSSYISNCSVGELCIWLWTTSFNENRYENKGKELRNEHGLI